MASTQIFSGAPAEGQTRMCLDAWAKSYIQVDGGVRLCCYKTYVGSLRSNTLDEVLNGPQAVAYRRGLLTGELLPMCKICGDKKIVNTEELKYAVEEWYRTGKMALH